MNINRLKVLHINSYYAGRKLHEKLYEHLQIYDIEQTVYIPAPYNYYDDFILENNDENIILSECFNNYDRFLYFRKNNKILNDIKTRIKEEKVDIMHAHSLFSNGYVAYKIWKKRQTPYVVTVRNADINLFFKKIKVLNFIGRRILKNAEQIILLSEGSKNYLINNYFSRKNRDIIHDKVIVIPNGIESFWLNNLNTDEKVPNSPIRLGIVGEILKNKNILKVIEAAKKLNKNGIKTQVYIAGRQLDNHLMKKIKKTNAIYLGELCKEELMDFYRNIDIFVLPSHHESFGLVYAEAISQGTPVVYTKNQGFDLQFPNGVVGYSVNSKSVNDIYDKIRIIIENYRDITTNIAYNSLKFSWESSAEQHYKIYSKIRLRSV